MNIPKSIFLLRKSRIGNESLILKADDLPIRFTFSDKNYVVEQTKSGKLIMKAESPKP
jgi:hypothetical protein